MPAKETASPGKRVKDTANSKRVRSSSAKTEQHPTAASSATFGVKQRSSVAEKKKKGAGRTQSQTQAAGGPPPKAAGATPPGPRSMKEVLKQRYRDKGDSELVSNVARILHNEMIRTEDDWKGLTAAMKESLWKDKGIPADVVNALEPPNHAAAFVTALLSGDTGTALKALKALADSNTTPDLKPRESYCVPTQMELSWKGEEWKAELENGRRALTGLKDSLGALEDKAASIRAPRVMGFHDATGSGKTHALLTAASHLNADADIYITYNLVQKLHFDNLAPDVAVLLRVLLQELGTKNIACDDLLRTHTDEFKRLDNPTGIDQLIGLAVVYFTQANRSHIFVGVDEICVLLDGSADSHLCFELVTSALGQVAKALVSAGIACTVVISSLTASTFQTKSRRKIELISLPTPDESARRCILRQLLPNATERQEAMLAAAAGTHFRSLVEGCRYLRKHSPITTSTAAVLFDAIRGRLDTRLSGEECIAIRRYVINCVQMGESGGIPPSAMPFVDSSGCVPPPLLFTAFDKCDSFETNQHPVIKIFEMSSFIDVTKQLEYCGVFYDQFRALYGLPVVPFGVVVGNNRQGINWSTFRFSVSVARNVDENSLLERYFVDAKRETTAVRATKHRPRLDAYVLPQSGKHPNIDRACLIQKDGSNEKALIIYKDRINAAGFSKAVHQLNDAADVLGKAYNVPVLCVAHVVGAGDSTRAQDNFRHPYVLVRDGDINHFYQQSFAPAIRYVVQRHELAPNRHENERGLKPHRKSKKLTTRSRIRCLAHETLLQTMNFLNRRRRERRRAAQSE